jgi:hypothetical protein
MTNMSHTRRRTVSVISAFVGAMLGMLTGFVPAVFGVASSTKPPSDKWVGDIAFRNYDFRSTANSNANNVDWGVNFMFFGHANVNYVKSLLPPAFQYQGGAMYTLGYDRPQGSASYSWFWDNDSGKKNGKPWPLIFPCPSTQFENLHMRFYARPVKDTLYERVSGFGFVVSATTHHDVNEGCSNAWFGDSEWAEHQFREEFKNGGVANAAIYPDNSNFDNAEVTRLDPGDGTHLWSSNGLATLIYV